MITQQFDRLGNEFVSVFLTSRTIALPQPGQHFFFGLFAHVVVHRSGNTHFWHNDSFPQSSLPTQGNNTFGADRNLNFAPFCLATVAVPTHHTLTNSKRFLLAGLVFLIATLAEAQIGTNLPPGFARVSVITATGPVTVVLPRRTYQFTPAGNAFYLATTGNDTNSGAIASPWKTFARAKETQFHAGPVLPGGHPDFLYCRRRVCARLRRTLRRDVMIDYIWTGIVSLFLLAYLLYALLKPERF